MEETQEVQTKTPWYKRTMTAPVATTVVTAAVAVGANVLSAYLSQKVTNKTAIKADTK